MDMTDLYKDIQEIWKQELPQDKKLARIRILLNNLDAGVEGDEMVHFEAIFNSLYFYLHTAIDVDVESLDQVFDKVIYDFLIKRKAPLENIIPLFVMMIEGLQDLIDLSNLRYESFLRQGTAPDLDAHFLRRIYAFSRVKSPLLIVGETGTSKGLLARAVHKMGPRRKKIYRELNCAALPENLIESELFGHSKGAFTGATYNKKGVLDHANGGTVVLDELGKMPLYLQGKLLKVIEDDHFFPVGSNDATKIDIRFIAMTTPDHLEKEVYPDLLYRLGYPDVISMPTLNERLSLVPRTVVAGLLKRIRKKEETLDFYLPHPSELSPKLIERLQQHQYVGNYRELENILRRAIISAQLAGSNTIGAKDLRFDNIADRGGNSAAQKSSQPARPDTSAIPLKDVIAYANEIRSKTVEDKIRDIYGNGNDLKEVLIKEGLPKKKYQGFMKQLKSIVGKNLLDLKKGL